MDLFDILSSAGINNPERCPASEFNDRSNFFCASRNFPHFEVKIGPIETADDLGRALDVELFDDIASHRRCCSRRQG